MAHRSHLLIVVLVLWLSPASFGQYTESFESAVPGSSASDVYCAATGGWTTPPCWHETLEACTGVNRAWRPWTGATPSPTTGPSGDHTSGTGVYMYCESSGNGGTATFVLTSPALQLPVGGNLRFFYHLDGPAIGTLAVEAVGRVGGWAQIWSVSGSVGSAWMDSGLVPLASGTRAVRFIYTPGGPIEGDAAIDDVTLDGWSGPPSTPAPTNANHAAASLTLNGTTTFVGCQGDPVVLEFSSTSVGLPHDIAVSREPLLACPIPLVDDSFEIDVFSALTSSFHTGGPVTGSLPVGLGVGANPFTVTVNAPLASGSLQAGAADPADPDGVALSAACTFAAGSPVGPLVLNLLDDNFTSIVFGAPSPVCFPATSVTFYGTSYTEVFINSNGDVSFTMGHMDFTATAGEWLSLMPRVGMGTDLEPNMFGTISAQPLSDGIVVNYQNVTEWGTGGMGVTSYDVEVSATTGAAILNFITDGTWGFTPTVTGISNGSLGTHPGLVTFDTFAGAGPLTALPTDSWIEENISGQPIGIGTNYNNVIFSGADGSTVTVN